MPSLKRFFIGELLRNEKDVVHQFRIRMVFDLIIAALFMMVFVLITYIMAGYGSGMESIRTLSLIFLFVGALFFLKWRRRIHEIAHLLLWLAIANYLFNLFIISQKFDTMMTLLAAINVIFAFHILGQRWGIIYFIVHFLSGLFSASINYFHLRITQLPPQQPNPEEHLISVILVSLVLVYLIYQYQEAFRVSKIKLEETLEELKNEKYRAEEMNRLKTNFLSNMSHEIRTPINGILGISQIIEMESSDPAILQYTEIQKQSGKRLLNTITSILNLARLESAKEQLKLHVIDVNKIVQECSNALKGAAEEKGLHFFTDISRAPLYCFSDATMLRHIITNVIQNAIKFTEKGEVRVLTSLSTNLASHICITVVDTGIGISAEFLPRIFTPFEQESTGHNRGYEGSGLGLPVSKRYIELMGGEISVRSEKNKGSTFQINLPSYSANQDDANTLRGR